MAQGNGASHEKEKYPLLSLNLNALASSNPTLVSLDEIAEKAGHFLARPEKAQAIARKGGEKVLACNTISERARHLLQRAVPQAVEP